MLELLTTCPRALEYNKLHQRIASNEKPSLNFGSAIHLALEYRYQRYQSGLLDAQYTNDIAVLLSNFFDEHPCPLEDFRNLNWALGIVKQYNHRYAVEEFSLLKYDVPQTCAHCDGKGEFEEDIPTEEIGPEEPEGPPATKRYKGCLWCRGTGKLSMMVELPFALPLFTYKTSENSHVDPELDIEIPVIYSGRIDLPTIHSDQLWVMDHKTTSMLGAQFFDKMRMSAQQKGYAWAFQELTGKSVAGYVINAIRTKEPPLYITDPNAPKRGKATSPEAWWNESLARERYYLKPDELTEWKHNAIALMEEFFYHYAKGYMPMKTAWCSSYGRCPYFDVCSTTASDRGVMLSSGLFTKNLWDPLRQPSQPKQ